jgi:dienelactone hydrolase
VSSLSPRGRFLIAIAVVLGASGCQSRPPTPPAPPDLEPKLQALVQSGYVPDRRYATEALLETWNDGDQELEVSFVAPATPGGGPYPLIVYLPGLGEPPGSGALWRRAWAEAGYAVLAVQPRQLTERIWASSTAREGDFESLAREAFSARSAAERIATLRFALDELARRAGAGSSVYRLADRSRIVLAGFDLGAQTVSLAAGEAAPGVPAGAGNPPVRAAIILSPYATRKDAGDSARFAAISLPVLSITGTDDSDPFGVVSDPVLRQGPWGAMPPGHKYLLVLFGGTHALLAGNGMFDPYSASAARGGDAGSGGQKRRRGRKGRRSDGDAGDELNLTGAGSEPTFVADASGAGEARARRGGAGAAGPRAYELRQIAAVEDVGAAFLDAFVKNDHRARDWLALDAARWLRASAALKVK